jgi:hypothetical protein
MLFLETLSDVATTSRTTGHMTYFSRNTRIVRCAWIRWLLLTNDRPGSIEVDGAEVH